jgi:hypothetical protein
VKQIGFLATEQRLRCKEPPIRKGGVVMKRNFLVIGIGLVLVLSLASVASALFGFTSVGDLCMANSNFGLPSHDTCVVCLNKGNNGQVCTCKLLAETGTLGIVGFTSFGDCVSILAMM